MIWGLDFGLGLGLGLVNDKIIIVRVHSTPFSISCVKCAIHTGTLEARMTVQVTRMARRVIGTVLREIEDTGNTTARNLNREGYITTTDNLPCGEPKKGTVITSIH